MHGGTNILGRSILRKTSLLPARQLTSQAKKEGQRILSERCVARVASRLFLFGEKKMLQAQLLKIEKAKKPASKSYVSTMSIGAMIGFAGGLMLMLTALILTLVGRLMNEQEIFTGKELCLLIVSLILLMAGAHCLDKIDEALLYKRGIIATNAPYHLK